MISAAEIAKGLGARRSGPHQWQGRCPSHKDHTPSLSITDGDDGRPLVHCHAGCEQSDVIEALRAKGLWGSNSNSGASTMRTATAEKVDHNNYLPIPDHAPPPPKAHPTLGEPTSIWRYLDEAGRLSFEVWRFESRTKKLLGHCPIGRTAGTGKPCPNHARSMGSIELARSSECSGRRDRGREGGRRRKPDIPG